MSNRIVITEEEKQTIKRLYESAPPPDESVLVTKKNPFNNKEYLDMLIVDNADYLRKYNKDMVDGDIFLVYDKDKVDEYFELIADEIYDKHFRGKSIRYVDYKEDTDKTHKLSDSPRRYEKHYCHMCVGKMYLNTTFSYGVREIHFPKPRIKYYYDGDKFDTLYPRNKATISDDTKNKLRKVFLTYKDRFHISKLPDEFFEIRKIVRTKTDF